MKKDNDMVVELELDEAISVLDSVELGSVLGGAFAQASSDQALLKAPSSMLAREVAF